MVNVARVQAQNTGSVVVNNDCNDLFISEVTAGKVLKSDGTYELNYAIEIYNPTINSIGLTNYSIDLKSINQTINKIQLNGLLKSGKCHVVANDQANNNLLQLGDELNANLDFTNRLYLKLTNKNGKFFIKKIALW